MGRRKKEIKIEDRVIADFADFDELFEYLTNQMDLVETSEQLDFVKECMTEDMWIELCSNIRDAVAENQGDKDDEFESIV